MYMKSKLTEQVAVRAAAQQALSAGVTAGISLTSEVIDRDGFGTGYVFIQGKWATGAGTISAIVTVAEGDATTATFTLVSTATLTFSITFTSAATTAEGMFVDLAQFQRFMKIYVAFTATLTNTCTVAIGCVLGDSKTEPAV